MIYLQAALGLILLVGAGDLLVRGAVSLARSFQMSPMLIGLTVVAFGTSAPELVVGVDSALGGVPTLALGNVVGSNIANVLLVIGLPALIKPLCASGRGFRFETGVMLAASLLFIGLCWTGVLIWWHGALLFGLLVGFLVYSSRRMARDGDTGAGDDDVGQVPTTGRVAWVFIILGLAGLALGAHMLIDGAVDIARLFGVSEAVIGLTLVAVGTSLPELATVAAAAYHDEGDVAIGNVIGSNLFNVLGVIGVTAIAAPVPVPDMFLRFDLWVMLASSLMLVPLAYRRGAVGRVAGGGFMLAYGLYIVALTNGMSATSAVLAG
ncbi:MAG: calcium/sodium antiporter [Sphingomonadales bacterium]